MPVTAGTLAARRARIEAAQRQRYEAEASANAADAEVERIMGEVQAEFGAATVEEAQALIDSDAARLDVLDAGQEAAVVAAERALGGLPS